MSIFSPITETFRGVSTYWQGIGWLRKHKGYFLLLFVPLILGILFLIFGWWVFVTYRDVVFGWILFTKPVSWWWVPFYYLAKLLIYLAFFIICLLSSFLFMNIVSCPIYEIVSSAVEKSVLGKSPPSLGLIKSLWLVIEEIKKVLFIIIVSILLLFIPGVNVISILVTAFLVGWDFYDYPLARMGWTFRQRFGFVLGDFWAVMGFGIILVIPFLNIFLFPPAIAGGTLLNLAAQKKRHILPIRGDLK